MHLSTCEVDIVSEIRSSMLDELDFTKAIDAELLELSQF